MTEEMTVAAPASTSPARVERFSFASLGEVKKREVPPVRQEQSREQVKRGTQALVNKPEPAPAPVAPAAPTFSAQELEAAKKEAYEKGLREGTATAEEKFKKESGEREEAVRDLLQSVANRITIAAESHARTLKEQEATLGKLSLLVARKLSGEALKREPYANVESLLKECMALIVGQPKIVINVAPARVEGLKQRVDTLRPLLGDFQGVITVEEDAALGEQDCRVAWAGGYAEYDAAKLLSELEALVTQKNLNT